MADLLILAAMVSAATVVLAVAVDDVLTQRTVYGGARLLAQKAVIFTAFYPAYGPAGSTVEGALRLLVDAIEGGRAYTAVVFNMELDDPGRTEGNPTLVLLVGDLVPKLYPHLQLCSPASCAMRGAGVGIVQRVTLAGTATPVAGVLPGRAAFFDPHLGGVPLDGRVVVRIPAQMLLLLEPVAKEEALTRAVFLGGAEADVHALAARTARGGLYLIPHFLAERQARGVAGGSDGGIPLHGGHGRLLGAGLHRFAWAARSSLRQEQRALTIRRMYGVRPADRRWWVAGSVFSTVAIPPAIALAILTLLGGTVAEAARWVLAAEGVVALALVAWLDRAVVRGESVQWE